MLFSATLFHNFLIIGQYSQFFSLLNKEFNTGISLLRDKSYTDICNTKERQSSFILASTLEEICGMDQLKQCRKN